jgi:hypothetical protein
MNIENGWNPDADINGNSKIDMLDIAIVSRNFGKVCSPQCAFLLYSENVRSSIPCLGSSIVARWKHIRISYQSVDSSVSGRLVRGFLRLCEFEETNAQWLATTHKTEGEPIINDTI